MDSIEFRHYLPETGTIVGPIDATENLFQPNYTDLKLDMNKKGIMHCKFIVLSKVSFVSKIAYLQAIDNRAHQAKHMHSNARG